MKVYESITDLIGGTPLMKLSNYCAEKLSVQIFMESWIFQSSRKRQGQNCQGKIEKAEQTGALKENAVIIEPTSGNTGIRPWPRRRLREGIELSSPCRKP